MRQAEVGKWHLCAVGNEIIIQPEEGEKRVFRVVPDPEFCYKVQKTQIKARGGAEGLVRCIKSLEWSSLSGKFLENVYSMVKEAKV